MTFSLRSVLIAVAFFVVISVFAAPYLRIRPANPVYQMENVGGTSAWEFASLNQNYVFKGTDIPVLIINRSYSKSVPYLAANNLPFAIYIWADNNDEIDIQSDTNIDQNVDATATLHISGGKRIVIAKYQLNSDRVDKPYKISERFFMDQVEYDLNHGRLFELDFRGSKPTHSQIALREIDRDILPEKFGGSLDSMRPILTWWADVKSTYQIGKRQQ